MKQMVKILCAFLVAAMLLPSQVLVADAAPGSQTQLQMHREQAMKAGWSMGRSSDFVCRYVSCGFDPAAKKTHTLSLSRSH